MLISLLSKALLQWIYEAGNIIHSRKANTVVTGNNTDMLNVVEQNEFTNRFVGWAVRELKLHWDNMHMDYCELLPILEFIDNMKIRHELAILDRIYMDECYSVSDQIHNKGGLTLVSMEYFNFGRQLVSKIYASFNEKRMAKDGNNSLENSYRELVEDLELRFSFLQCDPTSEVREEIKLEIMKKIMKKVMHAMSRQVTKKYNEAHTGHYSKTGSDSAFREKLKATSQMQSVKNALELEEKGELLKIRMGLR